MVLAEGWRISALSILNATTSTTEQDDGERYKEDVKVITVPRYLFSPLTDEIQHVFIHGLSDSSKDAYSAVVYLQFQSSNGFLSRLITSNTKVAPVQELTIRRLELLDVQYM